MGKRKDLFFNEIPEKSADDRLKSCVTEKKTQQKIYMHSKKQRNSDTASNNVFKTRNCGMQKNILHSLAWYKITK